MTMPLPNPSSPAVRRRPPPAAFVPCLVLAVLLGLHGHGHARQQVPTDDGTRMSAAMRQAFSEAAAPVVKSVVSVVVEGRQAALGVIVSREGHVLTKASELRGAVGVRLSDGRFFGAQLVGAALEHDLAMIQLVPAPPPPLVTVPAGAATQPGAPRPPLPTTAPASLLGQLTPILLYSGEDPPVGRWVAAVGPASPTPLAVGVVSVGRRAIPAAVIMGVVLQNHTGGGAKVMEVSRNGGAARAGLMVDDVIVAIDDDPVTNREDVTGLLARRAPGQSVNVRVNRDGKQVDYEVTLSMRPRQSDRSRRQNRMGGRLSDRSTGFSAVLQTDMVTLAPSQCGSPVVTLEGRVVGLNIARAGRTEMYVLPASVVRPLIANLRSGKYPPTTNPSVEAPAPATQPATTRPAAAAVERPSPTTRPAAPARP